MLKIFQNATKTKRHTNIPRALNKSVLIFSIEKCG